MPELVAWVNGRKVGHFNEEHLPEGSQFSFQYLDNADAEHSVSLTMIPLPDRRRFDSRQFPPAFDMILPEGQRRQRIEAARKIVGLAVPTVTLSADGELLLVERFDTLQDGTHLGFEEVAVLRGETSATKYQRDYGSMIESLAAFIAFQDEEDMRRDVTMALVLNWLLGNGDAHLKNFGVLYHDDLDVVA